MNETRLSEWNPSSYLSSLSSLSLSSSPYNDNNYSASNYNRCINYISTKTPVANWTGVVLAFIGDSFVSWLVDWLVVWLVGRFSCHR